MQIELKLFASLATYLPSGVKGNVTEVEVADGATPYQIIDQFKIPREEAFLVMVNGVFVTPEDRDIQNLQESDTLALWPPVAGG